VDVHQSFSLPDCRHLRSKERCEVHEQSISTGSKTYQIRNRSSASTAGTQLRSRPERTSNKWSTELYSLRQVLQQGPYIFAEHEKSWKKIWSHINLDQSYWNPVEPAALSEKAVKEISEALVGAKEPLVIVGYTGRNHATVPALVKLADTVKGLRVLDTGGSDMCFPADHRAWLGLRYSNDDSIRTADVILIIDCGKLSLDAQKGFDIEY
jgi:hypothetical protein